MNDYSKYHNLNIKDKLKSDGRIIYDTQLDFEGVDVDIDGVITKVLIQDYLNPMNENKEDRKLFTPPEILIKRGSYVTDILEDEIFIVLSKVDKGLVYNSCKIEETNNYLNFSLNGQPYSFPCVASRKNYTIGGVDKTDFMTTNDSKMVLTVQNNQFVASIPHDFRFIIDDMAWKILTIDKISMRGLAVFVLKEDIFVLGDDKDDKIASNENVTSSVVHSSRTSLI